MVSRFTLSSAITGALCVIQALNSSSLAADEANKPPAVVAYSKAFAKRFSLPELLSKDGSEGGLEAVEFTVEPASNVRGLRCKLRVYIPSGLAIAYPADGVSGARAPLTAPEHFFLRQNEGNKRWLSLQVEDRAHFSRQDTFRRSAALASLDLNAPAPGYWRDLIYEAYYRGVFPGLDYIKLDSDCGPFADVKPGRQIQLWLKKEGGRDYRYTVTPRTEDFHKFSLPSTFLEAAIRPAQEADQHNRSTVRSQEPGRSHPKTNE